MTSRGTIKAAIRGAATVLVTPLLLVFWAQSLLIGRDRAIQGATQLLAPIPGISGQYLRRAFLVHALESCHPSATIEFGTIFSRAGARIEVDAYIGPMCVIGLASIGAGALVGPGVHIPSGPNTHGIGDPATPIRDQEGVRSLVRIGEGAWIGSTAVIMADIGDGAVIGAGAVVTRAIPARVVAAGVPARVIRSREAGRIGEGA